MLRLRTFGGPTRRRTTTLLAIAALVTTGLGFYARRHDARGATDGREAARAAIPPASVAILPFLNTPADPENEPFIEGLTDELIGALGTVSGLKVTGRASAFALKGRRLPVATIGDTLGVATVLEGSVRRDGDRLAIAVKLVSTGDSSVLWSKSYDRPFADVFSVQEEIARSVVVALTPRLRAESAPTVTRVEAQDLEAYELYLDGRYFLSRRTPGDLRLAADYFELAIERDPGYARAFAALAEARTELLMLGRQPARWDVGSARAAAAQAVRLDSTLAEGHVALGNILEAFEWDWSAAERELVRATTLDPGSATAHLYRGIALLHRRRLDESLRELKIARTLDPLSAAVHMQLGRAYLFAGKPADAVETLRAALALSPDFPAARQHLGDAYLQQGKSAEAIAEFRLAAQAGGARDSAQLVYALATAGQREEATHVLGPLAAAASWRYLPPVPMAIAYAGLGDNTAAFRWLERAYSDRAPLMNALAVMPAFVPLHTDLRWKRLERLMRFGP